MTKRRYLVRTRWTELWRRRGVPLEKTRNLYDHLHRLYADPDRAYHNLDHVGDCHQEFDVVEQLAEDPDAMRVAIPYHDAVYRIFFDRAVQENEAESAALMRADLGYLAEPTKFIDTVETIILSGTKHQGGVTHPDAQLMSDIDLAGFGQSWAIMVANSRKIRYEFRKVPFNGYIAGRRAVLKMFIERGEGLYYKPLFREEYGARALRNLQREHDTLPDLVQKFDIELGI